MDPTELNCVVLYTLNHFTEWVPPHLIIATPLPCSAEAEGFLKLMTSSVSSTVVIASSHVYIKFLVCTELFTFCCLNCAMTDLIKLVTVVMLLFCTVLHLSNLCSETTLNRLMIATTLPLQTSFWITLLVFTRGEARFLQASLLWCSFDSAPSTAPLRWHFYNLRYNVFVFSFARASHHFYIHSLSQICIFSSIKCENGGRPFYEFLSHAHWL